MSRLQKSLYLLLLSVACFTLARAALLVIHYETFASLTATETFLAFFFGLHFDFSSIFLVAIAPLCFMNLPFSRLGKRWFSGWAWLWFSLLSLQLLILAGDLVYFGHTKRHVANEALLVGNDIGFLTEIARTSYLWVILLVVLFVGLLGYLWNKGIKKDLHPIRPLKAWGIWIGILLVGFLAIRGNAGLKPISIVDAFSTGNVVEGQLRLNGFFSMIRSHAKFSKLSHVYYKPEEVRDILGLPHSDYPLLKQYSHPQKTGHNIVLLILESWTPEYLASYEGTDKTLTPNFDRMAKKGLKFEEFYASGQRSIEGIQAILTGVPPMIGHPELAYGLEMSHLTEVGTVARKHGYKTLFGRTAQRDSFRLLTAAQRVGFTHVFGMEDVPRIRDYPTKNPRWGWDYDTLMYGLEKLNKLAPPFLSIFFTATTHKPFPDPGAPFHRKPYSPSGKDGFTNSLYYADWALGEFMKKAEKEPWFSNTIFILTADQVGTRYLTRNQSPGKHLRNDFRIPLVLYAPGIIEPGVNRKVSSHVDLMPTLFDLLGFNDPFSSIGESVLKENPGFAIVKQGSISTIFTSEGVLQHSLENRLNSYAFEPHTEVDFDALERKLLSVDQITYELLLKNRWCPPVSQ